MPKSDPTKDLDLIDSVAEEDEELPDDGGFEVVSASQVLTAKQKCWRWIKNALFQDEDDGIGSDSPPDLSASEAQHKAWHAKQEYKAKVAYLRLQNKFAGRLYRLVKWWLMLVIVAVFLNGFGGIGSWRFNLTDKVLITFITSTTASVLGLFVLVARWLFESKSPKSAKTRTSKVSSRD